jgi:Protein of unknown function (DUF3800)
VRDELESLSFSLAFFNHREKHEVKFCYLDESGTGNEAIMVMAGVLVDSHRMHRTKEAWDEFLKVLSTTCGRQITEFHACDFYSGNSPWRSISGEQRAAIITSVLDWIRKRRHSVVFTAIQKNKFDERFLGDTRLSQMRTMWCTAAFHLILGLQRQHQPKHKTKGHTVLVFDRNKGEGPLAQLVSDPPTWSHSFYAPPKKIKSTRFVPLNLIVDVPYFADSHRVLLLQVADLLAYVLRCYIELNEGLSAPRYEEEARRLTGWMEQIRQISFPSAARWPSRGRNSCHSLFYSLAPHSFAGL